MQKTLLSQAKTVDRSTDMEVQFAYCGANEWRANDCTPWFQQLDALEDDAFRAVCAEGVQPC